jgi:hypothetical protein
MTTATAVTATVEDRDHKRSLALLKAVGLDRVQPEQRELALAIAKRYDLDLMLKHLVLIDGRPYITRDALLHVAHRSGQLDGIEVTDPVVVDDFWRATCSVYRKDMSRPFTYAGRYPTKGGNQKFAPEMAVKVAESMALRRAFDVSAPTAEERWDAEVPQAAPEPPRSLAERVAEKAAEVATSAAPEPSTAPTDDEPAPVEGEQATGDEGGVVEAAAGDRKDTPAAAELPESPPADAETGEVKPKLERCPSTPPTNDAMSMTQQCAREKGHTGAHKSREGSWPQGTGS